jgi:hypothetical protein
MLLVKSLSGAINELGLVAVSTGTDYPFGLDDPKTK